MALPEGLLSAVKNYLDITWEDGDGDTKLTGIVSRGMSYLDGIAGTTLDYEIEAQPRALLFDYCRYVRSGLKEDFETNFFSELIALQNREAVRAYEEEKTTDV